MTATPMAQKESSVRIEGLLEVILHVYDMNTMVSFYRDKLRLSLSYPMNVRDFSKESWVTFDAGSCIFVLHSGGRVRSGEQPSHRITFKVSDVKMAREYFVSRGVELGPVRSAAPGVSVVDGRDPEGNVYALESHA